MRITKSLKKKTQMDRPSIRRASKKKSSSNDVVRCPKCGAIAEKYDPYHSDDENKASYTRPYGSLTGGLGGNRRDSKYVLYRCTKCKKIFRVRKKKK